MSNTESILIVDDTPANISVLMETLGNAGYQLFVAESGESALAQLGHATPDLILLDVIMPGIDGFTTCRRIRELENGGAIPVLFMTMLDEPSQKIRAFEAGASDYIVKPFFEQEVLARVRVHLDNVRLRCSLEDELALRLDAENQLSASLDLALLIVDADNTIQFSTRLAEDYLHSHFPNYQPPQLPDCILAADSPILVSAFSNPANQDGLRMLRLEQSANEDNPSVLRGLGLTSREAEVLFWVAQGKSNPDVATIINAGVRTVHKHVENIFRKLGCETRSSAALTAAEFMRGARR